MELRLRTHRRLFRAPLVVIQISESKPYNYDPATDLAPGGYRAVWRDATPEDLLNRECLTWPTHA